MKKLFTLLAILLMAGGSRFAQGQTKRSADSSKAQHVKADGSADKRFKENRRVKPVIIPTKKDGTPDMRYKASKAAKPTQGN